VETLTPAQARKEAHKALVVSLIALAVSLLANVAGYTSSQQMQTRLCEGQRDQLVRAEVTLPGLAYFREHPNELKRQLAEIRTQRESLGDCEPSWLGVFDP
jgi:hypothetical protein